MILLDTHVLVWLAGERERLSPPALEVLEAGSELVVCVASIQEIAYLAVRGRLIMDRPLDIWVGDALSVHEVRALESTVSSSLRAGRLDPDKFHGDPIDRLIYAMAVEHDARLVTADTRLRRFDPERTLW